MTYGEAKEFVSGFLLGDNSNPEIRPLHFKMAMTEVGMLCVPEKLKAEYTGAETDVLRLLPSEEVERDGEYKTVQHYVKMPPVSQAIDDADSMPIDEQLSMAVIFFVCSYLSKKYTDRYEKKAAAAVSLYVSNVLAA
ncbi:hypothetical protein [Nitratifractor salsuginis]|uniref:Uncharacterized protein n=1 Tax=Nitratifractor salsuginis (strain DSM 16511 / JCM 12458 / E9I37-1) TaxID=749222 RepID=E6WY50_NITSE|nr:hypothetical protein [Nitratifractor salsuginis]ADV46424.1 hypothetical protein Nitsa_1171 [Nitratifractor salsuginis DSM 16511]